MCGNRHARLNRRDALEQIVDDKSYALDRKSVLLKALI